MASTLALALHCRPGSWKGFSDGCLFLPDGRFRHRPDPHEFPLRRDRRGAGYRRRRAARPGPGHDSCAPAPRHVRPGTHQRVHYVRRHLLRRHVRRLHHLHPAKYAGRIVIGGYRHRRQQDGQSGTRGTGSGDGGDWLVRCRHHWHRPPRRLRTDRGEVRRQPGRTQLHGHHGPGAPRRHSRPGIVPAPRLRFPWPGTRDRPGGHGRRDRPAPADVWPTAPGGRSGHRGGGRGDLRCG